MRQLLRSFGLFIATALVVAGCGSSSDSGTNDTGGDSTPGAVTGLVVTPGDGANTLTWEAVEGAVSYEIYWTSDAGATARDAECDGNLIEGITGTSYTHTGLTNGVGYRYAVTALNGDENEGECPSMSASFVPVAAGGGGRPIYGCNHPDAINYDPTVTVYVPGSCWWPTPTPTPIPADTTPPTTTVALATASKTSTTWTGSATINEAGTGYCTALPSGSAAPTATEVKADNNANKAGTGGSVAMTANGAATCTVTGLLHSTIYDIYFVAEDAVGNLQTTPSGPVRITTTPNIAWTFRNGDANMRALAYGNGRFIAGSDPGGAQETSTNGGVTWSFSVGYASGQRDIVWTGTQFVGVGRKFNGGLLVSYAATSPTGAVWTGGFTPGGGTGLNAIAWSGSLFVAVGNPGIIVTSPDGTNWTQQVSGTGFTIYGVTWSGTQFIALTGGKVLTSPDGVTWTQRSPGTGQVLVDAVWSGSLTVAVGDAGTIVTSPDGVNWTPRTSGTASNLNAVIWTGSVFVAVGSGGTILASTDGVDWVAQTSGTVADLNNVVWSGSRYVAHGNSTLTGE